MWIYCLILNTLLPGTLYSQCVFLSALNLAIFPWLWPFLFKPNWLTNAEQTSKEGHCFHLQITFFRDFQTVLWYTRSSLKMSLWVWGLLVQSRWGPGLRPNLYSSFPFILLCSQGPVLQKMFTTFMDDDNNNSNSAYHLPDPALNIF